MSAIRLSLALFGLALALGLAAPTPALANTYQTCTKKCADDEQACLNRTGNKGQCGNRANECTAKCR